MKKLLLSIFILSLAFHVIAQDKVEKVLAVFPYQEIAKAQSSISSMYTLESAEWKKIFSRLDDDSLKLAPTYAIAAFVHDASKIGRAHV